MMDIIARLTILAHYMIYLIAPGLLSIIAAFKVFNIRRNKVAIVRNSKIPYLKILVVLLNFIFFSLITGLSGDLRYIIISNIVLFVVFYSAYITAIIESITEGIYNSGIIYPGYSTNWNELEGYILMENCIRFIHKTKGAFDIKVCSDNICSIKSYIEKNHAELKHIQRMT